MSDHPTDPNAYFDAVRALDEALDLALGRVRAEQDAGRLTAVQAAAERVGLLERHLAESRRLRRELSGDPAAPPTE
jgi:hypothetical protein